MPTMPMTRRHTVTAVLLLAVAAVLLAVPTVLAGSRPEPEVVEGPPLRLVTANLLGVNPEPSSLLAELHREDPDLLLVQELTPGWEDLLVGAGWLERYPHHQLVVRQDSFGIGLLSRHPLEDVRVLDLEGVPAVRATVVLGTGESTRRLTVYDVHTLPPRTVAYTRVRNVQLEVLERELEEQTGAVVVAGDLNLPPHGRRYRALVDGRMRDLHHACGSGRGWTWPNGVFLAPPLRLDHVFASAQVQCHAMKTGEGEGSDHRPVVVDLVVGS